MRVTDLRKRQENGEELLHLTLLSQVLRAHIVNQVTQLNKVALQDMLPKQQQKGHGDSE